ncbi:hypothetical protein JMJ77_0000063, partial [Colletotrichum scovillei]
RDSDVPSRRAFAHLVVCRYRRISQLKRRKYE